MNRRGFFSRLAALAVAPAAVRLVPVKRKLTPCWTFAPGVPEVFKWSVGELVDDDGARSGYVSRVDYARGIVTVSA